MYSDEGEDLLLLIGFAHTTVDDEKCQGKETKKEPEREEEELLLLMLMYQSNTDEREGKEDEESSIYAKRAIKDTQTRKRLSSYIHMATKT